MQGAGTLDTDVRVKNGRRRERQIAEALQKQHGFRLTQPTDHEDRILKIDRWLHVPGERKTAVQIKYRESGEDLLVEVFDRWDGWDDPRNKIGRDVQGNSRLYCVLRLDGKTVVLAQAEAIKAIVADMLAIVKQIGWTTDNGPSSKSLRYVRTGGVCILKVQTDPYDGRTKMIAFIPPDVLVASNQAKTYEVALPTNWKKRESAPITNLRGGC